MSYLYNDQVGFRADAIDAFNRLKVSQPFTLFDNQNRYQINDKFDIRGVTGGSTAYNLNESTISLIAGTTAGSKVYSETKKVFPYQPGKSLLVIGTFAMNQPKSGLRQRLGYFGCTGSFPNNTPYNGIYLEQSGNTLSIVMQSASLGTTTTVNQADWNGDKFNGTGDSGRTLDVTKGNIFWMDIEWLGVGDVRTGFFVDGRPVIAHTFHNDNVHPTTYMTTACLPYRYEIENLTGQTESSTLKQICTTVMSEAGFEGFSRKYNVSMGTTERTLSTAGTSYPVISIRLNSNRLDSIIVPSDINAIVTANTWVNYRFVYDGTFGGAGVTWTTHSNGNVDYVIHNPSTTLTGSTEIVGGYINNGGVVDFNQQNNFNFQLGRTQTGVSDVLTLMMSSGSNNGKVLADLSWHEII